MRTIRRFLTRLTSFVSARTSEDRLQSEIDEHIAIQTEENRRAGLPPDEARRQAILNFGPVESIRETYRDQRGLASLETLLQDTRHALRRLRLAPAFTIATILTLALGIGATTSIFTLVHAVLLKSLPVANPAELVRLGMAATCCFQGGYSQGEEFSLVSYELYRYLRDNTPGFSELAAFPAEQHLFGVRRAGSSTPAQTLPGEYVSGNYFRMFGLSAYAGRALTPADDRPGATPVAVMSFRLWQQAYDSSPSVIGAIFNLNDKPVTIVGIAPPGFFGDSLRRNSPDFFVPLNIEPYVESDADLNKADLHWLQLIGRLRPGAHTESIEAQMRVELKQWLRSHWADMTPNDRARFPEQTLNLRPGGAGMTAMRQQYERWLSLLMAVTGVVLLLVCANVANLMLVRGMERRRQTSLSMALGARASRLIRQPLIESLLLSFFGGAAGLAVAFGCTRLILRFAFATVSGLAAGVPISPSPSAPVLLFALAVSMATGIVFGIAPAWMATRVDPIEALRGSGRSTALSGTLPRKTLVVLQAALSLVLLSVAGLLGEALLHLEHQNFGFDQDRRIVVTMNPRLGGYRAAQLPQLYRRILDSFAGRPSVSSVALCAYSPLSGGTWGSSVAFDGRPAPGPANESFSMWNRVSPGYFDVIGTPIVRGRGISAQDTPASPKVAVINETFARKYFPNEDPIGKHFGRVPEQSRDFEIVGVAKDARYLIFDLDRPIRPFFFLAETQAEYGEANLGSLFLRDTVIVTKPGANLTIAEVRQTMASVDPGLPLITVHTLADQVTGQFTQQRLIARLTSFFGILSLLLASIGLYGVTAFNAGRRVTEVGVRMALGASRADVVTLILRGASLLIFAGLLVGLPLTFALGRFLGSQLYGVDPHDPLVILVAVLTLGLSALIAAVVPAVRASSISPSTALRSE
jgi:predicted permease